jgi:hypothetical protein
MIRVFSADGRLLRRIGRSGVGPDEFDLMTGSAANGDERIGVETDKLDVQYIVRYRSRRQ